MYDALKLIHVACVVFSITGFVWRGYLAFRDSPLLRGRLARTLPHVIDALLLSAALGLAAISHQYPFVDAWLTAKVLGLLAYIVLGSLALRRGMSVEGRALALGSAIGVYAWIVSVALTRRAIGFWAGIA